jgi:type IV secretion system protein TrbI
VSRPEDSSPKETTQPLPAPTGLDLHPEPESSPRVSKRVGIIIGGIGILVLLGFAYGGYRRSLNVERTARTRNLPTALAPAADAEIVKAIPAGNAVIARKTAEPPDLEPPDEQAGTSADPCAADNRVGHRFRFDPQTGQPCGAPSERIVVRRAGTEASSVAPPPTPREPTPEERILLAAYQQEQAAMIAPTAIRNSEPTGYNNELRSTPDNSTGNPPTVAGDLAKISELTKNLTTTGASSDSAAVATGRALLRQPNGDEYNNQNEQNRKQVFLEAARSQQMDDYLRSTREAPLSRYEIKAGWEIPAVLEQGLNSDLPGELKVLVAVNIYDTASGKFLLIPQGSRLIGKYDSRVSYGQSGVEVVWNRIIFPDASSVDLNGMEGLDAQGSAGLRDKVDRHYKRLFGFAALSSLFSAAFDVSQRQNQTVLSYPSATQTAEASVSRNMTETGSEITRRNLNVQPTIKVPVGYRFTACVNRDIMFDAPYESLQADPDATSPEKGLIRRSGFSSN